MKQLPNYPHYMDFMGGPRLIGHTIPVEDRHGNKQTVAMCAGGEGFTFWTEGAAILWMQLVAQRKNAQ